MPDTEVVVIGAGVVGLAIATRLARKTGNLFLVEANERQGLETSSRNSEVIHGGMYYPAGSLKATLCVEGNRKLYEFCARQGVPHRRLTKIIVASRDEDEGSLFALLHRGKGNGVNLTELSAKQVHELEPNVVSRGGLFSPDTGVVSAEALMSCLLQLTREAGATVQFRARVVELERRDDDYRVTIASGGKSESFTAGRIVNAAGLEADNVARLLGVDVEAAEYRLRFCKGSYFSVAPSKWHLVSRLVYPLPSDSSLGIHAVLDLSGRLRFGPDSEYLDDRRRDYAVDATRRHFFGQAARTLLPALSDEDLFPDIAGIRPKLQGLGEPFRDFVIAEETSRGLPGVVNLIGIDSPGLTAALAIAEYVARLLSI